MRPEDRSRDGGPAAQLYGRPSSPQRTGLLGLLVGSMDLLGWLVCWLVGFVGFVGWFLDTIT